MKSGDFVDFLFEGIDHFITNHYNQTEMEIDAIRIIIGSGGKANLQFYNSSEGTVELTVDVPRWTIIGVSLDLIPDLLAWIKNS